MKGEQDFELKIVDSLDSYPPREERDGIAAADLVTTPEEALEALKASRRGISTSGTLIISTVSRTCSAA